MAYNRVNWEDSPSTNTPINSTNLNKMDAGIEQNAIDIEELQDDVTGINGDINGIVQYGALTSPLVSILNYVLLKETFPYDGKQLNAYVMATDPYTGVQGYWNIVAKRYNNNWISGTLIPCVNTNVNSYSFTRQFTDLASGTGGADTVLKKFSSADADTFVELCNNGTVTTQTLNTATYNIDENQPTTINLTYSFPHGVIGITYCDAIHCTRDACSVTAISGNTVTVRLICGHSGKNNVYATVTAIGY